MLKINCPYLACEYNKRKFVGGVPVDYTCELDGDDVDECTYDGTIQLISTYDKCYGLECATFKFKKDYGYNE